jgi:hypothetical protein
MGMRQRDTLELETACALRWRCRLKHNDLPIATRESGTFLKTCRMWHRCSAVIGGGTREGHSRVLNPVTVRYLESTAEAAEWDGALASVLTSAWASV